MTTDRSLQIRRLEPSDAALYREIRLEGLRISPEAFGSTFEKEDAQPLSWFEAVLGCTDIFGAFLDGTLAGVAAYAALEGSKQAHKATLWACTCETPQEIWGLGRSLLRRSSTMHANASR